MYEKVKLSQKMAREELKSGIRCSDLIGDTLKFFASKNYKTDRAAAVPCRMFHSLGHRFGLEIHEEPRISSGAAVREKGKVITLEPGLYCQEIGGVRIEDDFLISGEGSVNLSEKIHHDWVMH